ncbi:MAG: ATP/GTP-binding protein [Sulfurospirillaceae bacterium]|nr:ATP/GTP-binding protein [Sulfurospirillaceae bacterium]MDD2826252.1 ATP/GTP-binding protein [Sulfurospirillaceae bacterium]
MNSISASNYAYNDFSLSLQTSSGDTINLKMYDEKAVDFSHSEDKTSRSTTLSLSHAYGYSFEYNGDGIDENDKKEIQAAMKLVQPMIDEYLNNVQKSEPSTADITNTAFDINTYLPKQKDSNTKGYLNDNILKSMDNTLATMKNNNEKILQNAQKLFDAILKQNNSFELYM